MLQLQLNSQCQKRAAQPTGCLSLPCSPSGRQLPLPCPWLCRAVKSSQHLPSVQLLPVQPASQRQPAVQRHRTGISDHTETPPGSEGLKSGASDPPVPVNLQKRNPELTQRLGLHTPPAQLSSAAESLLVASPGTSSGSLLAIPAPTKSAQPLHWETPE